MKKIITLYSMFFFASMTTFAQVGLGTTEPQETLHVAGTDSTIRIEGLNNENNSLNQGGANKYNVLVNAEGNLSLGTVSGELFSEAAINIPVEIATTVNSGMNSAEIYKQNFTLDQKAIVVITYYMSVDFKTFDGSSNINDGRAKIAHNYFYLGDGTTADTSKTYGMTSTTYTNLVCDTATGFVYNSRSTTISLEPGTYSIHLNGAVFGGDLTPNAAFSATFGDLDRLDVDAIYL